MLQVQARRRLSGELQEHGHVEDRAGVRRIIAGRIHQGVPDRVEVLLIEDHLGEYGQTDDRRDAQGRIRRIGDLHGAVRSRVETEAISDAKVVVNLEFRLLRTPI